MFWKCNLMWHTSCEPLAMPPQTLRIINITCYSFRWSVLLFSDVPVHCPDQTGIVGKPLIRTCTVTCDECSYTNYIWSKNTNFNCTDKDKPVFHENNCTFYCTILNTSQKHNGTFKFRVQRTTGTGQKEFLVTIGSFPLLFYILYKFYTVPLSTVYVTFDIISLFWQRPVLLMLAQVQYVSFALYTFT